MALRAGAPILPVGIIGAEQIYPMIAQCAESRRHTPPAPISPVTPNLPRYWAVFGLIPLPAKCHVEVRPHLSRTVDYGPEAADDPGLVRDLTERVRRTVQAIT